MVRRVSDKKNRLLPTEERVENEASFTKSKTDGRCRDRGGERDKQWSLVGKRGEELVKSVILGAEKSCASRGSFCSLLASTGETCPGKNNVHFIDTRGVFIA